VILADLHVGGHQVLYLCFGAPEHNGFGRRLDMIIDDLEGTGSVPNVKPG